MKPSQRKHLRYKPEKLETALVMFDGTKTEWMPDDVGLIIDESAISGAQIVLKFSDRVLAGSKIKVKLGNLEPLSAEVAWRKEIAGDLFRIGVKFLE